MMLRFLLRMPMIWDQIDGDDRSPSDEQFHVSSQARERRAFARISPHKKAIGGPFYAPKKPPPIPPLCTIPPSHQHQHHNIIVAQLTSPPPKIGTAPTQSQSQSHCSPLLLLFLALAPAQPLLMQAAHQFRSSLREESWNFAGFTSYGLDAARVSSEPFYFPCTVYVTYCRFGSSETLDLCLCSCSCLCVHVQPSTVCPRVRLKDGKQELPQRPARFFRSRLGLDISRAGFTISK
ncbi:hypothetical protein F5Y12DRAFT_334989 [Xylaria sp. FL1777]|nr:hypothetical protein F5Y12DRAFT_334989 [Xylaria sp. FL1777]